MIYVEWNDKDILYLYKELKLAKIYTEIDDKGTVCREIGIDENGEIAHRYPDESYQYGEYGLFDNQVIECNQEGLRQSFFEGLWER